VYKGLMDDPAAWSVGAAMLHGATVRRLYRRAVVTAHITVPAVPQVGAGGRVAQGLRDICAVKHRDLVWRSVRGRDELPHPCGVWVLASLRPVPRGRGL